MSDSPSQPSSGSEDRPPVGKRRGFFRRRWLVLALLILAVAAFWRWHGVALERLIDFGLREGAGAVGLQFEGAEISARLGAPIVVENAAFGPAPEAGADSRTRIRIARVELALPSLWDLVRDRSRLVARLSVFGLEGVLDFRSDAMPPVPPPAPQTREEKERAANLAKRFMPVRVTVERSGLTVLADGQVYALEGIDAVFEEHALGSMEVRRAAIDAGRFHHVIEDGGAVTAWRDGALSLSGLEITPGIRLERFSADLVRVGGLGLEGQFSVFGGWLQAQLAFGGADGSAALDAAARAGGIPLPETLDFAGFAGCSSGFLRDARFSFSGPTDTVFDSQASLSLTADRFRWEERGWDTLELGVDLLNRRVTVSKAVLMQDENRIRARGHWVLEETFDLETANFELQVDAGLSDLRSLADLAGGALEGTTGSAKIEASLSGASGELSGGMQATGEALAFQGVALGNGSVDIVFRGTEARIGKLLLEGDGDRIAAHGDVQLSAPFRYQGSMELAVRDLARYRALVPGVEEGAWPTGGLTLHWQGDGTAAAHSGAIEATISNIRVEALPEGVSGAFAGTYSPENLHLGKFELEGHNARLTMELSAGKSGVYANHIALFTADRRMAGGQIYMPFDPRPLLQGKPWTEGVLESRELYANLRSADLSLEELMRLAGQDAPLRASMQLGLRASGRLDAPVVEADFTARGIVPTDPGIEVPTASLDLSLRSGDGKASVSGSLTPEGFPATVIDAEFPFGIRKNETGNLEFVGPEGPLTGKIAFPKLELAMLRPFLPDFRELDGTLAGEVLLSGTLTDPAVRGNLRLDGAVIQFDPASPRVEDLNAAVRIERRRAVIERFQGTVGAGPFSLTGSIGWEDFSALEISLNFNADRILLVRDPEVLLRANIRLTASGAGSAGKVSGAVRLADGRIYKRLEITPLLVAGEDAHAPLLLPEFSGLVPEPFDTWAVDVGIKNDSPFVIQGNIASGEIEPYITIGGTLGDPRPSGTVVLRDVRAYLPFTVLTITEGRVTLQPDNPRVPMLDIRATGEALQYRIQAYAYGPLDERNILLRSDPPLSQEEIILLITAGLAPGVSTGVGFGEAAVGQGGLLLLKTFVRQFETDIDLDSFVNRLQIRAIPPVVQGEGATLRGLFRLTDSFSLMTERDGEGFYNAGMTYTLRFR